MPTPVVTVLSPGDVDVAAPIVFTAVDDVAFRKVIVIAKFIERGVWEVVHDGTSFGPGYESSSRSEITGGYSFSLLRRAGWLGGSMQLEVVAVDSSGIEA